MSNWKIDYDPEGYPQALEREFDRITGPDEGMIKAVIRADEALELVKQAFEEGQADAVASIGVAERARTRALVEAPAIRHVRYSTIEASGIDGGGPTPLRGEAMAETMIFDEAGTSAAQEIYRKQGREAERQRMLEALRDLCPDELVESAWAGNDGFIAGFYHARSMAIKIIAIEQVRDRLEDAKEEP